MLLKVGKFYVKIYIVYTFRFLKLRSLKGYCQSRLNNLSQISSAVNCISVTTGKFITLNIIRFFKSPVGTKSNPRLRNFGNPPTEAFILQPAPSNVPWTRVLRFDPYIVNLCTWQMFLTRSFHSSHTHMSVRVDTEHWLGLPLTSLVFSIWKFCSCSNNLTGSIKVYMITMWVCDHNVGSPLIRKDV